MDMFEGRVELGMGSPRTKWYLSSFFDFFGLPFLIGFSPWEFGGPTKKQGVSPLETSIFPRKTPRFYTSTCVAVACPTHSSGTDPPVWVLKPGRVGGSGDEVGEDVRHFLIKMAKNCENKWRWTLPCILYRPIDGFNFGCLLLGVISCYPSKSQIDFVWIYSYRVLPVLVGSCWISRSHCQIALVIWPGLRKIVSQAPIFQVRFVSFREYIQYIQCP